MNMIKKVWVQFQTFLAKQRTLVLAICSVSAPTFLTLWFQPPGKLAPVWLLIGFLISQVLLVVASITPSRYAKIQLLEIILPSIYKVLELNEPDRITIHHISSRKNEEYEQLTDYHPTKIGRGRVYKFSEGIVGKCFKKKVADAYAIPPEKSFENAMESDWSFTKDQIARLTHDRTSFFVFPIGDDGPYAKAVLYLDSARLDRLTKENVNTLAKKIEELFLPQLQQIIME